MNYDKSLIITCEFMAVKGFLILLCATTIFVELSIAEIKEPWMGKEIPIEIKFLSEPKDLIVAPGQNAKFSCEVSVIGDDNSVSYSWKYNGGQVYKKGKQSGILTINTSPAKKEKEGLYHCIANTTFGLLKSRAARLKFADISSPSKDIIESEISASEGENVRLSCEINSVPEAQVTWYFDAESISNRTDKYLISTKYLYINNTQKTDAGEYSCIGTNPMTKGQARLSFILNVDERLKIREKKLSFISPEVPKNLTVVRGRNLSLHCHVNKANALVRWLQVDLMHQGGVMSRYLVPQNSFYTLEFGQIDKENRYEYTCVAEIYADPLKKHLSEQIKQVVHITVGEAPTILGLTSSREMENLGIPKRFYCNVSGYPPPIVKWFHNGEEVESNNKNHRFIITSSFDSKEKTSYNSLTVQDLEYRDGGVYQCVAENEFGSTSSATVLKIGSREKIPPPVTGVKCYAINTTDILVTFDPSGGHPNAPKVEVAEEIPLINSGDGGSSLPKITAMIPAIFVVSFFREGDPTSRNAAPAVNGSVIIGNLKPNSLYTFYVRRYDDRLGSDPSNTTSCSTYGSMPGSSTKSEPAPKAQYLRLLSDSIFLYWPKFYVDLFQIHVENVKNSSNEFRVVSHTNYTVISNLTIREPYKISVYPDSHDVVYEPIKINLKQIDVKYRFQVYRINESSVVLVWNLDARPEILKGYQIRYKRREFEGDVKEAFVEIGSTFFLIYGLTPGETYDVSLFIVLEDGLNDYPTKLADLTFTMAQEPLQQNLENIEPDCRAVESEIRCLWYYAEPTYCIFLVKYRPLNSTEYKLRVTSEKNVRFYDVPADFGYEISIQALNEDGEVSNFTPPVTCKTKPATAVLVPGQVVNISYTQVGSKVAYLSWQRPEHFDPSKYNYVVSYGIRNQTKADWKAADISAINTTEMRVRGDSNSVRISGLVANTEYVIMIRVENTLTSESFDGPKKIIVLQPRPEERDETFIGLVIGGSIGVIFILVCIISAICGKRFLKQYYYERNDSIRSLSTYKKPDMKILAKNSTVFKNSAAYGNGTNLQLPLLSNGTYVNGGVQITSIEGVRYCPGTGKKITRHEDGMLLHRNSPLDDTYEKITVAADTDRDREGGDSGYCDKTHSQSPPLNDSGGRRHRKSSDIPTDDGFHESNEIYINGSSPV